MTISASTTPQPANRLTLSHALQQSWQYNRWITLAGLIHIAAIPLILLGWLLDPKIILGAPAWIKPLKFAISGAIYCFSFVWLLSYVSGYRRMRHFAANTVGVALLVEVGLITMQVIRGRASHFNYETPFDALVYQIMGGFILSVMILNLILAIWLIIQRLPDRVFAWGLRWGVLLAFVGMVVPIFMTGGPTPSQLERMQAGEKVSMIGAHSVGVEDGGPGLPLLGWSTEGGDLRIPHFVGLHGMQLLPILGWLLTRPALRRRLPESQRLYLLWLGALSYLLLTVLLTWQALRGQSIIAPDGLTIAAVAGLAGGTVLVGMILVGWGLRQMSPRI